MLACTPHAEVIGIFWDYSDLHFLRPAHNACKSMPTEGSKRTPNDFYVHNLICLKEETKAGK